MVNKFHFYTVLLFLFLSGKTSAQKLWTLEDCINHAMKNNLQIQQAENNLEVSDQNLLLNRGAQLPTLNGSGTHNYNFGRNIDPFTNQFTNSQVQSNNFSLNSSLVLFNGLQTRNSIQQSRYDYMAANYQLETLKNDISLNISAAYLDILFNKELVSNLSNQLSLTKQQYERSQKLVEAGSLSPTALYDLKSQMASEEAQLVRTQNNLTLSYLNLSQYLDLPSSEPFEVVQPETLLINADSVSLTAPEEVVQTALKNQPQIKTYEYRRLSTLEALHVARGRQSPRLSLNAALSTLYSSSSRVITGTGIATPQYIGVTQNTGDPVYTLVTPNIYGYSPYGDQLKDNYNRFVGLTLSIPILNGLQVRTGISRAKLNADNAALDLRISKMNMEKTIRKAHTDAQIALSNFNASGNSVKASEEALRNAGKRLDVGLMNAFEYNQAKTRLSSAQSDLLRAKYDYIFKLKILDFYKGIPLKL
jgi:outer membrane protein